MEDPIKQENTTDVYEDMRRLNAMYEEMRRGRVVRKLPCGICSL